MIKVANIIEEGRFGGPQKRIVTIAKALRLHGVQTEVILPKLQSEIFQEKLVENEVKHTVLPLHRLTKEKKILFKYVLFFFVEIFLIWRQLRKSEVDIVHVSGGSWQYKGVIAGRLSGAKVIWHLNDTMKPYLFRQVFKCLAPFCADAFIAAGNRVKQYYVQQLKLSGTPCHVINAPVDCNVYDSNKVNADGRIAAEKSPINIGVVGNINPDKGLEQFVDMAAAISQSRGDSVKFWIIGPTHNNQRFYREKIEDRIRAAGLNQLEFYGSCADVKSVLKALDIYVCSSAAEASPMAVWEAMSMQCPVVSTDVGDVREILCTSSEFNFVADSHTGIALAEKVEQLIDNPILRTRYGKHLREVALRYLDSSIIAARHFKAYQSLISRPPAKIPDPL